MQLDFSEGSTITFPMEMHIDTNIPAKDENDLPRYLVIELLFKMGQANKFMDEFLNLLPQTQHVTTP